MMNANKLEEYFDFISDEGLEIVETLLCTDGRETIHLQSPEHGDTVLKIGDANNKYLLQEQFNLSAAQGIIGIPKLLKRGITPTGNIYFEREFVQGRELESKEKIADPAKIGQLTMMVNQLHSRGIWCIGLYEYNLVETPIGIIYLVDLGPRTDFDKIDKASALKMDNYSLNRLIA